MITNIKKHTIINFAKRLTFLYLYQVVCGQCESILLITRNVTEGKGEQQKTIEN